MEIERSPEYVEGFLKGMHHAMHKWEEYHNYMKKVWEEKLEEERHKDDKDN